SIVSLRKITLNPECALDWPHRNTWDPFDGIFFSTAYQRTDARVHLRPDSHRLHHGLWHYWHDQLRSWRGLHDRGVYRLDRHAVALRRFGDVGPAGLVHRACRLHDPDCGVGLDHRAHSLSPAALLIPSGAADYRDRD